MRADHGRPPDVVYALLTISSVGLYQALRAAGYEGNVVLAAYDRRIVDAIDGAQVVLAFAPYEVAPDVPRMQQMIDDVAAVEPDELLTIGVYVGYWSADMFLALLEETGRDVTVERFMAASNGWAYEVEGVLGRSEWPKHRDWSVPCTAMVSAERGRFVVAVPYICGKNFEISG